MGKSGQKKVSAFEKSRKVENCQQTGK